MGKSGNTLTGDQHRQKGYERHNGIDKTHAHILQCREAKRMVSSPAHAGGLFDMACRYCCSAPYSAHSLRYASEIHMYDKEVVQHADHHGDKRNTEKHPHFMIKLTKSDLAVAS